MASLPLFHAFGMTITGFMPLIEGIPAVYHPDPTDSPTIAKAIARNKLTIFCGTTTFLRLFIKNRRVNPLMLESLRIVVAGVERLNPEVRDAFKIKFGKNIFEGYGTTETAPVASVNIPDILETTSWTVQKGTKPGTVGMALPGSSFRIVAPSTMAPMPLMKDGLILISGAQVMEGYLNNPEKTKEVLVEIDGRTWYKTGDKGHLDTDGFLSIVDRYSRFAKIGGEMVSLNAIESAIIAILPEMTDIMATAITDEKKGERIVLLFAGDMTEETIKNAIKNSSLNPIMMPNKLIHVHEIPKLGSGKSDFAAAKKLALAAS